MPPVQWTPCQIVAPASVLHSVVRRHSITSIIRSPDAIGAERLVQIFLPAGAYRIGLSVIRLSFCDTAGKYAIFCFFSASNTESGQLRLQSISHRSPVYPSAFLSNRSLPHSITMGNVRHATPRYSGMSRLIPPHPTSDGLLTCILNQFLGRQGTAEA